MNSPVKECDEIRVTLERLRTLLENLVVRGLRACGPDELTQLQSFTEYLDQAGAGHVSSMLALLHSQISADDRASAGTLLKAQTAVRLLERLLTLRVVRGQFAMALAVAERGEAAEHVEAGENENQDEEE